MERLGARREAGKACIVVELLALGAGIMEVVVRMAAGAKQIAEVRAELGGGREAPRRLMAAVR